MPRILVLPCLTLCPEALDPLYAVGDVDYRYPTDPSTLAKIVGDYEAILCHADMRFDRPLLERATRLRIIATPSTGTDHLDKPTLSERGIELIDLSQEFDLIEQFTATAEGAWSLLLAAARRLPRDFERAKRGELGGADTNWAPHQLAGLTLGIVGHGRLGSMVGDYGKAFRMRVLAYDTRKIEVPGIEQVDLDTLLSESDAISLHLHLTDATRFMFDRQRIARMKKGVILVNTARGDLLDEEALVEGLEQGHIGGAGLDVFHDEWDPNRANHALHRYARSHDNLIITPHSVSYCLEGLRGARIFVARRLAQRLKAMG